MSDTQAYQPMYGANTPQAAAGTLRINNSAPLEKAVETPRLEQIANQHHQALLCLQELTVRLGRASDRLLGNRPTSPSQPERGEGIDHSVTHRLRRLGGETMTALELLAGEIQRLEEL